jgi:hypothetical protein
MTSETGLSLKYLAKADQRSTVVHHGMASTEEETATHVTVTGRSFICTNRI